MVDRLKDEQPGRISWVTDSTAEPPEVYLLTRGNYSEPSEKIEPSAFSALNDEDNTLQIVRPDNFLPVVVGWLGPLGLPSPIRGPAI